MLVLGIDPGTYKMGVGVVESDGGELRLACSLVLAPKRRDTLPQRLYYLYAGLSDLIGRLRPTEMAVEEPFAARNVRSALAIGQAQAVAMVAAAEKGLPVWSYAPTQVKQSVTDHGGSSKEQVQEMVSVLLRLDSIPGSTDASDALAVAICHINASGARQLDISDQF